MAEHSQHLEARRRRGGGGGGAATLEGGFAPAAPGGGAEASPPAGAQGQPPGRGGRAPLPQYSASAAARRASTVGGVGAGIGRVEGWERARPDPGRGVDPSLLGMRRLPHHADVEQVHGGLGGEHGARSVPRWINTPGRLNGQRLRRLLSPSLILSPPLSSPPLVPKASLEAEKHLKTGRHGEWAQQALEAGPKKTAWGVTLVPPGYDEDEHPEIAEIVRSQNKR